MNATEIADQIGDGGEIAAAIDESRYALVKQCQSIHQVETNYGVLRLTDEERDELGAWLTATLERRRPCWRPPAAGWWWLDSAGADGVSHPTTKPWHCWGFVG